MRPMKLNDQQQRAVEHVEGPLQILAGPGSGKTRVLVNRVAHLVDSGAAWPSEVLSVTFTNKAAGEMRRRLEEMVGAGARELACGTFHSICLKLLRRHAEAVGYGDRFVVYDSSDQLVLVKECMNALNIDQTRSTPSAFVERISRAKDSCLDPTEFEKKAQGNPYLKRVASIYTRYQARLKELQAMDFGDLIRLTVTLFEKNPAILESYQNRWRFIMVDEYQDTNHAQYRLVKALAALHNNLCVVGDDDQSVYKWRGADISNILRFEKDFPGAQVIHLEQNYRSTKSILAAAGGLVCNNAGRKAKEIWTENPSGEKITVVSCETERSEAEEIARKIAEQKAQGRRLKHFAIFYRTNAQSRPFEDIFRKSGIAYRIYGGTRFYERAEIKDLLAYLRLIMDVRDDVGLKRIVNVPARGLGKTTIEKLYNYAMEHGMSMFEAIAPFVASGGARAAQSKRLSEFSTMISELHSNVEERPLAEVVHDVLERTGYIEVLANLSTIESEAKLENINEFVAAVEEFVPMNDPMGAGAEVPSSQLSQFLDQVALVSQADAIDEDQGAVTMMTLHLAKGLEYPSVFMVGMEEGLFPHARSLDDPEELEEERRLCYVGMTRAEELLTLTHAFRRTHFGKANYNVASRFLNEIPAEYVERQSKRRPSYGSSHSGAGMGAKPRVSQWSSQVKDRYPASDQAFSGAADNDYDFDQSSPEEAGDAFSKGARVNHPTFGSGVILGCEKTSSGHRVTVRFRGGAVKRLIAEFAGLAPMV
jgi:ATP-dependent DNA helicase UvrD/PcrA